MNKRVIFASILLTIGLLFTIPGANLKSSAMSSSPNQASGGMRQVVFSFQDPTQQPPLPLPTVVLPTIVINPTPGPGGVGGFGVFNILVLLVVVLVGAVILIALVALLRRA